MSDKERLREPILWTPSVDKKKTRLQLFLDFLEKNFQKNFESYNNLHTWSLENKEEFWHATWQFCDIIGNIGHPPFLENADDIKDAVFFPRATLNFAENLLKIKTNDVAMVFWGEDSHRRSLTFSEVYDQVSCLIQAFKKMGVKKGDRVAGLMPHTPEAIISMLATTALGAIWCSCSPDFGVPGLLDRFSQIDPKILIVSDYYVYRGKKHFICEKLSEVQKGLPSLEYTLLSSYEGGEVDPLPQTMSWKNLVEQYPRQDIVFEQFSFNLPLFIMFSSGTTGAPKCIVHGAGGTLIQHMKEHQLHCDIHAGDRVFYFTTCGWMMWNWQISALASGATLMLYDGSPVWPHPAILFDFAERERITFFGTSAKYLSALKAEGVSLQFTHDLSALRVLASTGSPLSPEGFDYVYTHIKKDVLLASISGGTDIISCFVLGSPDLPLYRGEIQCAGLGMGMQVFDDQGRSIRGQKGELVCTDPFPSRPLGFWRDNQGQVYNQAYFSRFSHVWCHGDFAEITPNNGWIIYGRSDAVLNRCGVRIGTSEIYRQLESIDGILDSVVVGLPQGDDIRIILFVKLKENLLLTESDIICIKNTIRKGATMRHVPDVIIQAPDIPRTKSGKIVELSVLALLQGNPIKNQEALANPESLDFFRNLEDLKEW